jgi:hypothetical protein
MNAAAVTNRLLRKVGIVNGLNRIWNRDTDVYTLGYTKINTMATTAFSRTKTHKAWLAGDTDIRSGTRIQDLADNSRYIVMSLKKELYNGQNAYWDGTLYYVNEVCTIGRINNVLDTFGRTTATGFTVVMSGVWSMVNPVVIDVIEQPDSFIAKDKIKIAMQDIVDIEENDQIITATGEFYKVLNFSRSEIEGLVMVYVESDSR